MVEDNKKKNEYNIFIARSIYPDAAAIFSTNIKPLEEVKDDSYIVLDTNVLLAPYTIGKLDLLEQCRKTYSSLINQRRLIIPGQVAREFAKNRSLKLAELYQQLNKKKISQIQSEKYPLLSSFNEYNEVVRLEKEINTTIQAYQDAISSVLRRIQEWQWNDPVSVLYGELFKDDTVVEVTLSEEEITKDLERRQIHSIAPGYKDAAKDDKGVGDLIIWHSILEIGKEKKRSVIFVSGDEKADWFQKSEKLPLYPRYELVDEFRRASDGQSFYIIKFSRFLEIFGANEKVVGEVQQEEEKHLMTRGLQGYLAEDAVLAWVRKKFPSSVVNYGKEDISVDFSIKDDTGYGRGFVVLALTPGRIFTPNLIASYSNYKRIAKLNELFIMIVLSSQDTVSSTAELLKKHIVKEEGVTFVVGYMDTDTNDFFDTFYL